jgi:23S rRNA (cytosine1962-C5)-methyltransferase
MRRAAEGLRKYEDLNQLAISLVKPGGLFVTCSCSGPVSPETFKERVIKAAHRLNRRLQFLNHNGPGPVHPDFSNCLESRRL